MVEEYAPEIFYIKGIHNTVADAISQLEYDPKQNLTNEYTHATLQVPMGEPTATRKWTTFSKHWQEYNEYSTTLNTSNFKMNTVFANCSEDEKIYPVTTHKIAKAQRADATYKHLFKRNAVIDQGLEIKLIENTLCVCKDGRLVIPKPLQKHAVLWYHCYLQHPGPWTHTSRRDNECCDVLERYAYHNLVNNKVLQDLPSKEEMK
jgi:hypothetical protein